MATSALLRRMAAGRSLPVAAIAGPAWTRMGVLSVALRQNSTSAAEVVESLSDRFLFSNPPKTQSLLDVVNAVENKDDLKHVREALRVFRAFSSNIDASISDAVVSKYIEHGEPRKILSMIQNKRAIGLFPSRAAYHALMTANLQLPDFKNVVKAFEQMVCDRDELPDSTSYELMLHAALSLPSRQYTRLACTYAAAGLEDKTPLSADARALYSLALLRDFHNQKAQDVYQAIKDDAGLAPALKLTLETVFMAVNGDLTGAVKSFVSQQASLPQIPGAAIQSLVHQVCLSDNQEARKMLRSMVAAEVAAKRCPPLHIKDMLKSERAADATEAAAEA
ncbi:uncharacterized protein MONBRDRAFT_27638 [Monosiga brevicollis MX1]|uniref:Pentacotripeptide-repeat region of PRORP domain-containing protein n=1 Tax=Monosiga brevicollis TaxID=81824 RepID=A9V5V8_MONBE|nr:uncharacterized protein MONBRDRAFT_27638 [Monosiga brevicollis MX1]EDQ87113.1 predicted protein [Monosiga brevicollis MX1]|eukprot:XP_001748056.1 hypothetical protein [Monosiga brevicollis MX1]